METNDGPGQGSTGKPLGIFGILSTEKIPGLDHDPNSVSIKCYIGIMGIVIPGRQPFIVMAVACRPQDYRKDVRK